jgi:hypothetical protein
MHAEEEARVRCCCSQDRTNSRRVVVPIDVVGIVSENAANEDLSFFKINNSNNTTSSETMKRSKLFLGLYNIIIIVDCPYLFGPNQQ